ncbi:MAG: hypothetical protein AAF573_06355 [Bacteroidota bacterium]
MKIATISLYGLLSLAMLLIPALFPLSFTENLYSVYVYRLMAMCGLLLFGYVLFKFIKQRFRYWILALGVFELFIFTCFSCIKQGINFPEKLILQFQYLNLYRNTNSVQFDPELSQYDPELFYTLKPGSHTFSNLEFSTNFSVNSLGVRDDHNSIKNPKIICLGDSYTMGWGVEHHETFTQRLEKKTNVKVLNAGVSSYGTAREKILLDRLQIDSCKLLIIQFCDNDLIENRSFVENNFKLETSQKEIYKSSQNINKLRSEYYPFKWSFEVFAKIIRSVTGITKKRALANVQVPIDAIWLSDLSKIIDQIQESFTGKIILFHLEAFAKEDNYFPKIQSFFEKYPKENLYLFDAWSHLEREDYFYIDGHLKAGGHQKIADGISMMIEEKKLLGD